MPLAGRSTVPQPRADGVGRPNACFHQHRTGAEAAAEEAVPVQVPDLVGAGTGTVV